MPDGQVVFLISLEVAAGEIFAFLGPNGAGKTTTIKMLTTLLRPTSGTLEVDGLDPTVSPTEARKRFGIVLDLAVLTTLVAMLVVLGSYLFSRIEL